MSEIEPEDTSKIHQVIIHRGVVLGEICGIAFGAIFGLIAVTMSVMILWVEIRTGEEVLSAMFCGFLAGCIIGTTVGGYIGALIGANIGRAGGRLVGRLLSN